MRYIFKYISPSILGSMLLFGSIGCSSLDLPTFYSSLENFEGLPKELQVDGVHENSNGLHPLEFKANFDWPVDQARLTRGFMPHGRPRPHYGLDLAGPRGTPILASQKGTVIYAGSGFRGYGRFVIVEHDGEWATFYSHMSKILVKEGQTLDRGSLIGLMGRTGRATGNHLHFEIRRSRKAIDPIVVLPVTKEWMAQSSHLKQQGEKL